MNIVVCVKYVPDATADRKFESDNTVDRVGVDGLLSELDEYAVEQALQLKEKGGDDIEVTALCVGPEKGVDAVRKALQMGVDKGIHVVDDAIAGSDYLGTSLVLAKAVEKIRDAFRKQGVVGGLRLGVLGGGCSGLSYQFKFDPKPRPTDNVLNYEDVNVYIDPKSMLYLNGMTLDWKDSLMQSGFVFDNPNAKKNCGCGTSFTA